MLRKFESLRLIVGAHVGAVKALRTLQHLLVDKASHDLAVFEDERYFARPHFENGARAKPAGAGVAETRVEEARVMHAKFADQRIERHHFGSVIGRHLHGFGRSEDVKLVRIENEAGVASRRNRLPEIGDLIGGAALDLDY